MDNSKETMSASPIILLPPSEGKATGGEDPVLDLDALSFPELKQERLLMIKALSELMSDSSLAQKTLGVKAAALETARLYNSELTKASTMAAIERYTGVMYDFIDYRSLDEAPRLFFGSNTIIMSGLFGLVRPFDLIPNYKLKMGAKIRGNKTCSAIWKPLVTKSLSRVTEGRVVWDLLPIEHSAAWDPSRLNYSARFTVKFLNDSGEGKLRTLSHWSKAMKGALIRHLVSRADETGHPELALNSLRAFKHPQGYEFRGDMINKSEKVTELIFLKKN